MRAVSFFGSSGAFIAGITEEGGGAAERDPGGINGADDGGGMIGLVGGGGKGDCAAGGRGGPIGGRAGRFIRAVSRDSPAPGG